MKEKLEQQIAILEQAQNEALMWNRYELIVELSELILKYATELEIYK